MTPATDRIVAFLRDAGAGAIGHGGGRTLLDHLVESGAIARRWGQPPWLEHAALIHSVYGTERHPQRLVARDRWREVAAVAGERAERLARLFAVTPRRLVLSGTHRWAGGVVDATADELDVLVLLHLINAAEQVRAPDGAPGPWLGAVGARAELLADSEAISLPPVFGALAVLTPDEEEAARAAYRSGLEAADPETRTDRLALAAAMCPVVGEPCVWLADHAWRRGDDDAARRWALTAERRLRDLGVAWDKRRSFEGWRDVAMRLQEGPPDTHPDARSARAPAPTDRFRRYMTELGDAPDPARHLLYPDLSSRPWFDADAVGVAAELEAHADEVRREILALDPARFRPESERIPRSGDWDVVFLYERGRRHDAVCAACPQTTRIIESGDAMRTAGGLIYVSRMRPGTHIQPHRGPTNLRLRCHLGIAVPGGDCAIRVGDEARRWTEGRCLVFDDSFEHEAWNRAGEDRIVLIVDVWHPELSAEEVRLLAGLHRFAAGYGLRLGRYWATNDGAPASG